jgi:hypothetical protein
MGNVWYVHEGPNPTVGEPRCQLSFARVQQLFREYKMTFRGTALPRFPSSNPSLDDYRPPRFVVFELPAAEPVGLTVNRIGFQPDLREGFYQIEIRIEDCEAILAAEQL